MKTDIFRRALLQEVMTKQDHSLPLLPCTEETGSPVCVIRESSLVRYTSIHFQKAPSLMDLDAEDQQRE